MLLLLLQLLWSKLGQDRLEQPLAQSDPEVVEHGLVLVADHAERTVPVAGRSGMLCARTTRFAAALSRPAYFTSCRGHLQVLVVDVTTPEAA